MAPWVDRLVEAVAGKGLGDRHALHVIETALLRHWDEQARSSREEEAEIGRLGLALAAVPSPTSMNQHPIQIPVPQNVLGDVGHVESHERTSPRSTTSLTPAILTGCESKPWFLNSEREALLLTREAERAEAQELINTELQRPRFTPTPEVVRWEAYRNEEGTLFRVPSGVDPEAWLEHERNAICPFDENNWSGEGDYRVSKDAPYNVKSGLLIRRLGDLAEPLTRLAGEETMVPGHNDWSYGDLVQAKYERYTWSRPSFSNSPSDHGEVEPNLQVQKGFEKKLVPLDGNPATLREFDRKHSWLGHVPSAKEFNTIHLMHRRSTRRHLIEHDLAISHELRVLETRDARRRLALEMSRQVRRAAAQEIHNDAHGRSRLDEGISQALDGPEQSSWIDCESLVSARPQVESLRIPRRRRNHLSLNERRAAAAEALRDSIADVEAADIRAEMEELTLATPYNTEHNMNIQEPAAFDPLPSARLPLSARRNLQQLPSGASNPRHRNLANIHPTAPSQQQPPHHHVANHILRRRHTRAIPQRRVTLARGEAASPPSQILLPSAPQHVPMAPHPLYSSRDFPVAPTDTPRMRMMIAEEIGGSCAVESDDDAE